MSMETAEIVVIGAGAAGLAAAIFAAEECIASAGAHARGRVVVLEGASRIGAKILISGGGRCNVTHREVDVGDFNGSRNIVRNVLAAFGVAATSRWFSSLGVELKCEDTGKLFPVTDKAKSVLDALLRRCDELGVDIRTGQRVCALHKEGEGPAAGHFAVRHQGGQLAARQVVLAAGGRSLPRTGSDGSGWELARSLGHDVTPTYPALVPLVLDTEMFHQDLSGLSLPVELSTFADGKRIDRRTGSLLWTHFGISGPVVLDASRHWVVARGTGQAVEMRCSFLPGTDFPAAEQWLLQAASTRPRLSLGRALGQRLPERMGLRLAQSVGCDPALALAQVPRQARRAIAHALTDFVLPVVADRGWDFAEVTAGGVPLREIDYRTMESRQVAGLYLVGEILDCDGRIGGFNFQWAWATGFIAGKAAARRNMAEFLLPDGRR